MASGVLVALGVFVGVSSSEPLDVASCLFVPGSSVACGGTDVAASVGGTGGAIVGAAVGAAVGAVVGAAVGAGLVGAGLVAVGFRRRCPLNSRLVPVSASAWLSVQAWP